MTVTCPVSVLGCHQLFSMSLHVFLCSVDTKSNCNNTCAVPCLWPLSWVQHPHSLWQLMSSLLRPAGCVFSAQSSSPCPCCSSLGEGSGTWRDCVLLTSAILTAPDVRSRSLELTMQSQVSQTPHCVQTNLGSPSRGSRLGHFVCPQISQWKPASSYFAWQREQHDLTQLCRVASVGSYSEWRYFATHGK